MIKQNSSAHAESQNSEAQYNSEEIAQGPHARKDMQNEKRRQKLANQH